MSCILNVLRTAARNYLAAPMPYHQNTGDTMNTDKQPAKKRGRPKGSKNPPKAKDVTEALFYIADATQRLATCMSIFTEKLEELKKVLK